MKKNNSGFSLVELIIVIAIMAVLIGVLAPQFLKFVEKSRESTDLQNVEEVKTAVETYVADKGASASLPSEIKVTLTNGVDIKADTSVADYGVPDAGIKAKSSKWSSNFTWTYSTSTYTWTAPTGVHADYFWADGTDYS